jgi:predicted peptidase
MSVELPIVEGSSLDDSPQDPQIICVLWLRIVLDLFSDAVFSGTERKGNTLYHSSNPEGIESGMDYYPLVIRIHYSLPSRMSSIASTAFCCMLGRT